MAGAFTPEEWLAISPTSGVGAGANKTDGKGPSDDASYGDLFRTVARFSPLLARLQRLQTVCMRVIPTATAFLLDVVLFFGTLVLLAMIPSLVPNAGPATTIGIVFSGIWMAQHSVLCIEYVLRYRVNPVRGPPQGAKQIKFWAALFPQNNNLDDREANNVNDGIPAMAGRLLAHDPADELCPCGLASCSGTLPRQATTRYLISGCFLFLVMASTHVLTLWTPLVTLGYTVWRTWWGGLLGGVLLLIIVVQAVIHISRVSYHANERLQEISLRLQRRAAALVIGDLVKMVETDPESFAASSDPKSTALYAELYRQLVSNWNMSGATRSPTTHSYSGRIVYYSIPVLVVTIIINAAVGSCITAWQIVCLFYLSYVAFTYLFTTAAGNKRIDAVRICFSNGRTRLLTLLVEQPMSSLAAQRIRDHAELLGCFAGEAPLAKWMGFEVSWGFLRTLAATILTVVAALWGIIRGLGVQLTVESVCGIS